MVLNDAEIRNLIAKSELTIEPYRESSLSPASYDLSIGAFQSLNMLDKHRSDSLTIDKQVDIYPGEAFLASSIELLSLPNNLTGNIVGKSSSSRKGLSMFSPGWIDPGFTGELTMGMKNETYKTLTLKYGQKLWQVIFDYCNPVENTYQGHYQESKGIVGDKSGDATIGI